MRGIMVSSLGLSLALVQAGLCAEEIQWRPAANLAAPVEIRNSGTNIPPAVALGRPLPMDVSYPSRSGTSSSSPVALDRPIPFDARDTVRGDQRTMYDPQVMRTTFQSMPMHVNGTVRGQNPDEPQLIVKEQPPGKDKPAKTTPGKPEPGPGSEDAQLHLPREVNSTEVNSTEEGHEGEGELCWDAEHWCWSAGPCGPSHRFYGSVDYLFWWMKGYAVPPLVTTSRADTFTNGFLSGSDTQVLIGNRNLLTDPRSGVRLTAGYWFDDCQNLGIEGSYFVTGQRTQSFNIGSAAFPVIARPFFNLNEGREFSEVVASPDVAAGLIAEQGAVSVNAITQFWGAEANLRKSLCCDCCYRVDLLAGFRYLNLYDRLDITELEIFNPAAPARDNPAGIGTVLGKDSFSTRNQFYGGQLGTVAEYRWGRWLFNVRAKVALGSTHQVININGAQYVLAQDGTTRIDKGDLLALSSNSGHFSHNELSVVPEGNFDISYQLTEHIRAHAGYTFIYWSNVVRPGDQIDRIIDTTNIPNFPIRDPNTGQVIDRPTGQGRPLVPMKQTDFWAQGVNLGLEFLW